MFCYCVNGSIKKKGVIFHRENHNNQHGLVRLHWSFGWVRQSMSHLNKRNDSIRRDKEPEVNIISNLSSITLKINYCQKLWLKLLLKNFGHEAQRNRSRLRTLITEILLMWAHSNSARHHQKTRIQETN